MHAYATDSGERRSIPLLLAACAVVSAWVLPKIIAWLGVGVPWWFDAPSVVGFYGIYFWIFDEWMWKVPFFRKVGLINIPNLNGLWKLDLTTSFDQHAETHAAQIRITQRWRTIAIHLEAERSRSDSMIATLRASDPNDFILNYEYQNTPTNDALHTMHVHRGSAEIRFQRPGIVVGIGEYYSGRDRVNQGTLRLQRLQRLQPTTA